MTAFEIRGAPAHGDNMDLNIIDADLTLDSQPDPYLLHGTVGVLHIKTDTGDKSIGNEGVLEIGIELTQGEAYELARALYQLDERIGGL